MKSRIVKIGNSLALTIPNYLAAEAGLQEDAVVDLALVEGNLIVTAQPNPIALEKLLAGITTDNLHDEHDFGGSVGREI